jgi:hypothetical protein
MKAISLWEPWASLVFTGAKRLETRSWKSNYTGPLVICASKGGLTKFDLATLLHKPDFQAGLAPLIGKPLFDYSCHGVRLQNLNYGNALCVVDLVKYWPTEEADSEFIGTDKPFGDFSRGRWIWQFETFGDSHDHFR